MTIPEYPRWKFSRSGDDTMELMIWQSPEAEPQCWPMGTEEAWILMRGIDRVQAWAAQSAEGTFGQPAMSPDEARDHLSIKRYVVTSGDQAQHTKAVQASPWANWVEEYGLNSGVTWRVDVFAQDDEEFLAAMLGLGVTVLPGQEASHE